MTGKKGMLTDKIDVPEKVTVTIQDGVVKVKGPNGEVSKRLHDPRITIEKHGEPRDGLERDSTGRKEKALLGTYAAHLRNMMNGVTKGFEYKMKIVYAHFPIKSAVKGDVVPDRELPGREVPAEDEDTRRHEGRHQGRPGRPHRARMSSRSARQRRTSSARRRSRASTPGSSRTAST